MVASLSLSLRAPATGDQPEEPFFGAARFLARRTDGLAGRGGLLAPPPSPTKPALGLAAAAAASSVYVAAVGTRWQGYILLEFHYVHGKREVEVIYLLYGGAEAERSQQQKGTIADH
ncbi:hypothetical protein BRADI_4g25933v3 [Brachypodium distachyon]|uniref:Uncharacterized protein n=2 Tax=Brachypodium distachyon TaxID=15368 RepID=A0A0Q3LAE2_BRADI|nr:hypothetical protein BRADI_4g25933v3 [Brachypodium distachyon]